MIESIKVLVVDDSALVRLGVRSALIPHVERTGIAIVGEAVNAMEAVTQCERLQPDVVLLDVRLPGRSGIDACREIVASPQAPRVLMLTAFADDDLVYDSLLAGAHGYLMKELDPAALADAITAAAAGRPVVTSEVSSSVMRVLRERSASPFEDRVSDLSAQQEKVLACVADGLGNKQIADRLGLSANTVRNYLANVFKKLSVQRRAQAAAVYMQSKSRRKQVRVDPTA